VLRIDDDQSLSRREPEPPIARTPSGRLGPARALVGLHAVREPVRHRADGGAAARGPLEQVAPCHAEDPAVGAHPKVAAAVLEHLEDHVVEEAVLRPEHGHQAVSDQGQSLPERADPERAIFILVEAQDEVVGQAFSARPRRDVAVAKPADPATERADPEVALAVLVDRTHFGIAQPLGGAAVSRELPAREPRQTGTRPHPERAVTALGDRHDGVVRQAVGGGEDLEAAVTEAV
jgi:hypothetical protein